MADVRRIIKGQAFFFIGFFYILIVSYMMPPIIEVGEWMFSTFGVSDTTTQGIAWLFVIVFYLFMALIIPGNMIYEGISAPNPKEVSPFMLSILAIAMFIIGLIFTVKAWYIVTALADALNGDVLLLALYWSGLLLSWILTMIIAPVTIILQAQQEG